MFLVFLYCSLTVRVESGTQDGESPVDINDLPEYETEKATFEELQQQNSYFIHDLMNKQRTDADEE